MVAMRSVHPNKPVLAPRSCRAPLSRQSELAKTMRKLYKSWRFQIEKPMDELEMDELDMRRRRNIVLAAAAEPREPDARSLAELDLAKSAVCSSQCAVRL